MKTILMIVLATFAVNSIAADAPKPVSKITTAQKYNSCIAKYNLKAIGTGAAVGASLGLVAGAISYATAPVSLGAIAAATAMSGLGGGLYAGLGGMITQSYAEVKTGMNPYAAYCTEQANKK